MTEVVSGDNWSYKAHKAPVKLTPPTNQHTASYRPDTFPVAQPTVWKHGREIERNSALDNTRTILLLMPVITSFRILLKCKSLISSHFISWGKMPIYSNRAYWLEKKGTSETSTDLTSPTSVFKGLVCLFVYHVGPGDNTDT